jgi:hypothetical protein
MYSQLNYYYQHRQYKLEYQKNYYQKNKDKIKSYYSDYYKRKKNETDDKPNTEKKIEKKKEGLKIRYGEFIVKFD